MRKIIITLTVVALILSILSTGVIVVMESYAPSPTATGSAQ